MALKGNLRDFSITQLLNLVNLAHKTGLLNLEAPGDTAQVSSGVWSRLSTSFRWLSGSGGRRRRARFGATGRAAGAGGVCSRAWAMGSGRMSGDISLRWVVIWLRWRVLISRAPEISCFEPLPLRPRPMRVPPLRPLLPKVLPLKVQSRMEFFYQVFSLTPNIAIIHKKCRDTFGFLL